jgi:dihydroflavonol-4-reductase
MQILLTGATGFLGQRIAASLVEHGHRVRALVRRDLRELAALGIEQMHGQVAAYDDVCRAADGCDAIVHAAGSSDSLASLEQLYEANVRSEPST